MSKDAANRLPYAVGADMYNQNLTGGVSMTLTAIKTDPHHVPCVVISSQPFEEDTDEIHGNHRGSHDPENQYGGGYALP